MSAHAPGPWTITHWGINAALRAIVFDGTMYPEDARLISAAPDMLDALKDALECLEIFTKARWEDWDGSASRESSVGRIRAAIAKAEARS